MQFTYTKNSKGGPEIFGLGASPIGRRKSRKSLIELSPNVRKTPQAVNLASFGPGNTDFPITQETESQAFLSTQRTQRAALEPLVEVKDMLESAEEGNLFSLEDGRETKLEFEKLQVLEYGITLAAIIAAFLTVITYDMEFEGDDPHLLTILLYCILATNCICIILTIMRYQQDLKFRKARYLVLQKATIVSTGDIWYLAIEIVIFLIQPYPWLRGKTVYEYDSFVDTPFYYHINDYFSLLLVLRLYILGRFILNNLMYRSPRSHRIGVMYGAESGYMYACRSIMKVDAMKAVPLLLFSSIIIFGYMIRICERPLNRDPNVEISFSTYWNSMWCVILTMTTVGYGDVYARTMLGRTVSFLVCIWGTFVVSIMVVTLTGLLTMNNAEEKSLMILRRLEARKQQKKEAAFILTNLVKLSFTRKKKMPEETKSSQTKEIVRDLKRHMTTFRRSCREIKGLDDSHGAAEEVTRQIRFVGEDIKTLMETQKELQKTVSDFVAANQATRYPGSIYVVPESTGNFKGIDEDVFIHKTR